MSTGELLMIPLGIILFELGLALVFALTIKMFFNELKNFIGGFFGALFKPQDLFSVNVTAKILGMEDKK